MKIEDEIKQNKAFESAFQKVGVNLMYTYGWYTGKLKKFFKQFGLTPKQFNILRILKGAGRPVSTSFIRERLLDKNSDVSRVVDRMHEKGLIKKNTCSADKRLVDLELTEKSISLMQKVNEEVLQMHQIMGGLSEAEAILLSDLLDKMRAI